MRLNLGLGNSLYLTSELRQNISVADLCPPEIYQRWVPMIIDALYRIENGIVLDVSIEDIRVTPNHIETLNHNEIFVFGSVCKA